LGLACGILRDSALEPIVKSEPARAKAKKIKRRRNLDEEVSRVRATLSKLSKQRGPVLAGPFTGEVGFELLYWVPFLRWAVREFPDLRGRLVAISRGGTEPWIKGLDAHYVDILSLFPSEDFRRHRALADKQRQGMAEFEHDVCEAVKEKLGFGDAAVLHPSLLYQSYFRFLKVNQLAYPLSVERKEDGVVEGMTSIYQPIDVPDAGPLSDLLPDEYVAVRLYSSSSFPDDPEGRRFASAVIEALSRRTNVILLGHPFDLDEHRDVQGDPPPNVISIDHLLRPEDNLALQTAVVGRAKAFVGTYGGFSYLAPFLGVPSLSFSMDRAKTHVWHYELAQRIFEGPEWGDFVALRHSDLPLVELVSREFSFDGATAATI
jgi:hypothetical protein